MKADTKALKEQMAKMMEVMMSMKKIMEADAVAIATTSAVAKVNPMLPSGLNQISHPTSDVPMKGKQLVVYPCKTLWRALGIIHNYTSCIPQQVKTLMLWQKWESWII